MRKRTNYSKSKKKQIIDDCLKWKNNGGTIAGYAREHKVSSQTLYTWLERSNKTQKTNSESFVKLTLDKEKATNNIPNESSAITIKNSFCSIDVPTSVNKDSLIKILAALKGVS